MVLAVLIVWLLAVVVKSARERGGVATDRASGDRRLPSRPEYGKPCPLCGSPLRTGERVHSVVYPAPGESYVEIYGCPHCEPRKEKSGGIERSRPASDGERQGLAPSGRPGRRATRRCPVCRRTLEPDGYLVGRMQEKNGIRHLRILGCTSCRTVR